jgi:hypothetical protein
MRKSTLFALLCMLGCGGDDNTGPSANLAGTWSMSLSDMNGGNYSCYTSTPIQLTLTQTGTTFTGSQSGGVTTCAAPGGPIVDGMIPGPVVNGTLSGSNLSFDFDGPAFHHTGTVNGTSMSGTASWTYQGPPFTLNGNWSAVKQ